MVISWEQGGNDLHIVQVMPLPPHHLLTTKIQIGLKFPVVAYPGYPRKEAVKQVAACGQDTRVMEVCRRDNASETSCG